MRSNYHILPDTFQDMRVIANSVYAVGIKDYRFFQRDDQFLDKFFRLRLHGQSRAYADGINPFAIFHYIAESRYGEISFIHVLYLQCHDLGKFRGENWSQTFRNSARYKAASHK